MDETLRRMQHQINALNCQVSNSFNMKNRVDRNNVPRTFSVARSDVEYRGIEDLTYGENDEIALKSWVDSEIRKKINELAEWVKANFKKS